IDRGELEAARRDAVAAKANLKAYLSAPVKGQLVAGDVWLAQLWNGDAAQARKEQPALAWALPKEGGTLWIDSLVVPASAPHPTRRASRLPPHPAPIPPQAGWPGSESRRISAGRARCGTRCGRRSRALSVPPSVFASLRLTYILWTAKPSTCTSRLWFIRMP